MTTKKPPTESADTLSNTRIWDELWKTDPKHTKAFTRPGGFRGTATKPIWMTYRMTEHFGPCGMGWGIGKPDFQTMQVGSETVVYCSVEVWYNDSGQRATLWGVGGDKVFGKYADDEAFKKAYTDAVSNAMKFIGVCADIHMGMFEDSKYVAQMREEFSVDSATPAQQPAPPSAPPAPAKPEMTDDQKALKKALDRIGKAIKAADTSALVDAIMAQTAKLPGETTLADIKERWQNGYDTLVKAAAARKAALA